MALSDICVLEFINKYVLESFSVFFLYLGIIFQQIIWQKYVVKIINKVIFMFFVFIIFINAAKILLVF